MNNHEDYNNTNINQEEEGFGLDTNGEPVSGKPSLLGMITQPREQFERIRENPTILVPIIIVIILAIITTLFSLKGASAELDAELLELGEEGLLLFTIGLQITSVIVAIIAVPIAILIAAAIYLLVAKVAKSDVSFKQLFSMIVFTSFITSLGGLFNGIISLFTGSFNPEITSLNVIFGLDGVAGLFLSSIEVFSIWGIILTALGLQIVAKFPKGLAWGIVIAFTLIGIGFGVMAVMFEQFLVTI